MKSDDFVNLGLVFALVYSAEGPGQTFDETIVGTTAVLNQFSGLATFGHCDFTDSYVACHMVREKVVVTMTESITSARLRL